GGARAMMGFLGPAQGRRGLHEISFSDGGFSARRRVGGRSRDRGVRVLRGGFCVPAEDRWTIRGSGVAPLAGASDAPVLWRKQRPLSRRRRGTVKAAGFGPLTCDACPGLLPVGGGGGYAVW